MRDISPLAYAPVVLPQSTRFHTEALSKHAPVPDALNIPEAEQLPELLWRSGQSGLLLSLFPPSAWLTQTYFSYESFSPMEPRLQGNRKSSSFRSPIPFFSLWNRMVPF
jgi:hypothetical protein